MVQECVEITIDEQKAVEFEAAMAAQVRLLFIEAPGCMDIALIRSIEHPASYRLLIDWRTIDDHMVGFRNSDAFPKWRALVTPFLSGGLSMQHFEQVAI